MLTSFKKAMQANITLIRQHFQDYRRSTSPNQDQQKNNNSKSLIANKHIVKRNELKKTTSSKHHRWKLYPPTTWERHPNREVRNFIYLDHYSTFFDISHTKPHRLNQATITNSPSHPATNKSANQSDAKLKPLRFSIEVNIIT